ncbi:MAG TPA: TIGR02206 family membrane protein [Candidatus Dormibacteraeota bacterium]|nr:TIGR02206 family membrane protein [Candidatus Dormibacteraeota bacterium]
MPWTFIAIYHDQHPLKLYSPTHIGAIVALFAVSLLLIVVARAWPGAWTRYAAWGLAVLLVVNEVTWWGVIAIRGEWGWDYALPLYLCDAAGFVAAIALVTRGPLMVEITYFWGLAGTIQAMITPDLHYDFPTYFYFQYFVQHIGIVVAALFLVVGLGIRPRRGAVLRLVAITIAFTALAGVADVITGGNYMYLHHKPVEGSLLDYMGAWPLYIAAGIPLAVALLVILDLPFWRGRRRSAEAAG